MAKLSTDELLDAFKEMTIIELSEFVKNFEETFGVTAAAPVAVAAAPGAGAGAYFIGEWVDRKLPWAHLDIAGKDWNDSGSPTVPEGASGYGVRLLDRLVRDHYE